MIKNIMNTTVVILNRLQIELRIE